MKEKRLNVGIIGAGRIGKVHAETLAFRVPGAAPVAIADIELIVCGIHRQVGGAAEILRIGVAAALAPMAELRQELALRRELEDLVVLVAASRQPDVVLRIDKDAVLGRRPLVTLAGAAP